MKFILLTYDICFRKEGLGLSDMTLVLLTFDISNIKEV